MKVKCVVACYAANGRPRLFPCEVESVTPDDYDHAAAEAAARAGHVVPGDAVVFREADGPAWLFAAVFEPAPAPGAATAPASPAPAFTVPRGKKLLTVELSALTRLQWTGDVLVDEDFDHGADGGDLVDEVYDAVDGGDYDADDHFWERGEACGIVEILAEGRPAAGGPPCFTASVADGVVEIEKYKDDADWSD